MKYFASLIVVFITALQLNAQQSPVGTWNTGQKNTLVEIKEVGNSLEGKIVASDNAKAPLGKRLIKDIKKQGDTYEGQLYSIKKDKWFDAKFNVKSETLEITVSAGLMKKTIEWTKPK